MIGIPFFGTTDANGALILTRKIDHAQRVFKLHWFVGQFDAGVDAVLANAGLGVVAPGLTIADSPILTLTNANADAWYPVVNADNALVDQVLKLTISSGGANKSGGCIVYVGEESEEVAGGDASAANQATGNASLATIAGLSKAEDAAHASADPGVMLLAVRKDTAAALAGTDGDYIPLIVDASGRLWVDIGAIAAGSNIIGATYDAGPSWTSVFGVTGAPFASADAHSAAVAVTDAPTSGQKLVITDIVVSVDTAMSVTFTEETSGTVIAKFYMAANGVAQITTRSKRKLATVNKKLMVQTSVAGNIVANIGYYSEA